MQAKQVCVYANEGRVKERAVERWSGGSERVLVVGKGGRVETIIGELRSSKRRRVLARRMLTML